MVDIHGKPLMGTLGVVIAGLWAAACAGSEAPPTVADAPVQSCVAHCSDRSCGSDGCGGSCGECAGDQICAPGGQCVAEPPAAGGLGCEETCADLGLGCGDHCGVSCGECAEAERCRDGQCECAPTCTLQTCGQDDGCGASCPPCPADESCDGCALRLSVVQQQALSESLTEVTLAVDLNTPEGAPRAAMADLRIRITGPATVRSVGVGPTVTAAGKALFVDQITGRPFRTLQDGTVQVLIFSTDSHQTMAPGRLLVLKVRITRSPGEALPATFQLVAREETLAPPAADALLWASSSGSAVVVWPEMTP